jgi:hypothetical protein
MKEKKIFRDRKVFWYVAVFENGGEYRFFSGLDRGVKDGYRKIIGKNGGKIVAETSDILSKVLIREKDNLVELLSKINMNGKDFDVQEELDRIFDQY